MNLLSVLLGGVVGFSTGLVGAGGSLLAIPLLVSFLGVPPRDAFAISLAATGASCLVGVIPRIKAGQVDLRAGLWFAAGGMVGAPPGTRFASFVPETFLLATLAILMVCIAIRTLWRSFYLKESRSRTVQGRLSHWSAIPTFGLVTGFLSGLFGIGCGFLIIPGLVWLAGKSMHRAVATTLFVMALVSSTGAVSYFAMGKGLAAPVISGLFVGGAIVGVISGGVVAGHLSEVVLRRAFASVVLLVAGILVFQLGSH